MRIVYLMVAAMPALAQSGPAGDKPLQSLSHPDNAWSAFLKTNPNAAELTHQQGQLHFLKADRSQTLILGAVTHQDATGKWVPNNATLSSTTNGWRIDGTANDVVVRKVGAGQHAITQTFTDSTTKHASAITLTVPTLLYDKDFAFHFTQSGLTWRLIFDQAGTVSFQSSVAQRRGPTTYSFPIQSSEELTTGSNGDLAGGPHVHLSRAVMVPKSGSAVPCSAWTWASGTGSFTCDDSSLKDLQLPYQIDPGTATFEDWGPYNISASHDSTNGSSSTNAVSTFNNNGTVPTNATITSQSCGFWTNSSQLTSLQDADGFFQDSITCTAAPFSLTGTTTVTVAIVTAAYNDYCGQLGQC